jgi:hypothetical protein
VYVCVCVKITALFIYFPFLKSSYFRRVQLPASTGFLFGLLFGLEYGSDIFLRNVGVSPNYTVIQPSRGREKLNSNQLHFYHLIFVQTLQTLCHSENYNQFSFIKLSLNIQRLTPNPHTLEATAISHSCKL